MALRGNLKDFSLPDVFQLVTFSKKTGVLRIKRADEAKGSVWFREGEVFFAQSNWHREPLGERLVAASKITPSALGRALDIRQGEVDGARRLGQILVDEGYITDKVLEAFVQEQIQDTIFDLMRWDEGEFDFELLPEVVDEDIGLSVSIENVIMEGSRRLEEWARIKKKVPSMEVVFKMATAPGEGTFEISLKPIEWELLLLVDGTRSVSELASETNRTDFEVARIVYGLFSAGLLEFAADDEVVRLRAERAARDVKLEAYRAKQRKAEEAAAREAQEREEALAAAAARRREAEAAAKAEAEDAAKAEAEAAEKVEVSPFEGHEAPEVPEFLAGQSDDASANDLSVFEEMMGAVLQAPEAPVAETAVVEVEPVPSIPVEEPGFLSVDTSSDSGSGEALLDDVMAGLVDVPASAVEPEGQAEPETAPQIEFEPAAELEIEPETAPQIEFEPAAELEIETESEDDAVSELEIADIREAEPEIPLGLVSLGLDDEAIPPSEDAEQANDDLQADLMALGLGELPTEDLLTPVGSEYGVSVAENPIETDVPEISEAEVAEESDIETVPEPSAEILSLADSGDLTIAEIEAMAAEIPEEEAPHEIEVSPEIISEVTPDFSDLLLSLEEPESRSDVDVDVDEVSAQAHDVSADESELEPGGESEIDELDREAEPSGGVISTDAFLDEIAPDENLGLSGGLGLELSALTGAGGRTRPSASVNKLPEPGNGLELHRDQTVDKDLVLKIIEGLKEL